MQRILYFNKEGYCTKYREVDSIFTIMCNVPDDFETDGIPIEEFVCQPSFSIINGRHINKENPW
jgi:hypothetical protein